jgi:hypothetical protein
MKRPSNLSESLHLRLNSYALAASAAGVGVLALAQPAEGKIVYTPADVTIGWLATYNLDLNHDGINDFKIVNFTFNPTSPFGDTLLVSARHLNKVERGTQGFAHYAAALPKGVPVGNSAKYFAGHREVMAACASSSEAWGPWVNVRSRYLGLRFKIHGGIHYGWVRLTVQIVNPPLKPPELVTAVTGYAYETISGKAIITGKTQGRDVITVQPASLGALAAGASGLHAWRAKESQ